MIILNIFMLLSSIVYASDHSQQSYFADSGYTFNPRQRARLSKMADDNEDMQEAQQPAPEASAEPPMEQMEAPAEFNENAYPQEYHGDFPNDFNNDFHPKNRFPGPPRGRGGFMGPRGPRFRPDW